jgi:hypothetical protein
VEYVLIDPWQYYVRIRQSLGSECRLHETRRHDDPVAQLELALAPPDQWPRKHGVAISPSNSPPPAFFHYLALPVSRMRHPVFEQCRHAMSLCLNQARQRIPSQAV